MEFYVANTGTLLVLFGVNGIQHIFSVMDSNTSVDSFE